MSLDTLEAARNRRGAVAQRSHRPRERRSVGTTPGAAMIRAELRAQTTDGRAHFTGTASAYEQPYEMFDAFGPYSEVVSRGAGARSLARSDLDVTLNIGHDQLRRIARTTNGTLTLSESPDGLEVDAPALNRADHDVDYIIRKIEDGLFTEMSFAFRITRGSWSPDYTEYRIDEYDLHRGDVAIVGYGANPNTSVQLRTTVPLITDEDLRLLPYH